MEGLDAIFVGRADLAVSMGGAGSDDALHAAVERILRASRAAGLPALLLAASAAELAHLRELGATDFLAGSDQGFLRASAARVRASFLPAS